MYRGGEENYHMVLLVAHHSRHKHTNIATRILLARSSLLFPLIWGKINSLNGAVSSFQDGVSTLHTIAITENTESILRRTLAINSLVRSPGTHEGCNQRSNAESDFYKS